MADEFATLETCPNAQWKANIPPTTYLTLETFEEDSLIDYLSKVPEKISTSIAGFALILLLLFIFILWRSIRFIYHCCCGCNQSLPDTAKA